MSSLPETLAQTARLGQNRLSWRRWAARSTPCRTTSRPSRRFRCADVRQPHPRRLSDRLRGSHFVETFHQRLYDEIEDHIRHVGADKEAWCADTPFPALSEPVSVETVIHGFVECEVVIENRID